MDGKNVVYVIYTDYNLFNSYILGDGLGLNKDGITKPLKANFKFNNAGLGHNQADDMNNHWWENVYNQAPTNLNVKTGESNEVLVGLNNEKSVEITTKNYSIKKLNKENSSKYAGSFLKSATLTSESQEIEYANKKAISPVVLKIVSDEELFKACGGRTAHKGARHGLKLAGKLSRIEKQERELIQKIQSATEDSSKIFKDYADSKSRYHTKKLKRLHRKKSRKVRDERENSTSMKKSSEPLTTTCGDDENMDEEKGEERVEDWVEDNIEESVETVNRKIAKKERKNKLSKVEKKKQKHKKKLKKLAKKLHVADTRDNFLKKMAIEELPISFDVKLKKTQHSDVDDVSLHSYRVTDANQSRSDNDNEVEQNILSQLSEKLSKVKKNKQKVIVENLTEFQMEHLRNANVPFVEIKQSTRKRSKKNEAKLNHLANNLVDKMSIG